MRDAPQMVDVTSGPLVRIYSHIWSYRNHGFSFVTYFLKTLSTYSFWPIRRMKGLIRKMLNLGMKNMNHHFLQIVPFFPPKRHNLLPNLLLQQKLHGILLIQMIYWWNMLITYYLDFWFFCLFLFLCLWFFLCYTQGLNDDALDPLAILDQNALALALVSTDGELLGLYTGALCLPFLVVFDRIYDSVFVSSWFFDVWFWSSKRFGYVRMGACLGHNT